MHRELAENSTTGYGLASVRLISRGNLHFRWKSTARSMPVGYSASLVKAGLFLFLAGRFVRSSPRGYFSTTRPRPLHLIETTGGRSRIERPRNTRAFLPREDRFHEIRFPSRDNLPTINDISELAKFPFRIISFVLSSSRTILIISDPFMLNDISTIRSNERILFGDC